MSQEETRPHRNTNTGAGTGNGHEQAPSRDLRVTGAAGMRLPEFETGLLVDGKYRIIDLLGQGGMGVVYKAHHLMLNKEVAIKFLRTECMDERAWQRFQLEARTLGRLKHRNLVAIHDLGVFQGQFPYYVMDILEGESLWDMVRRSGPLTEQEALEMYIQAAMALQCAHDGGVIHRDVKPANIVMTWEKETMEPVVKVVDFGLAKMTESNQSLTKTGEVFGSPLYMSPEQCEGLKVDARSDIYSLGASLFESLTGKVPFMGASALETMLMHQQDEPPALVDKKPDGKFSRGLEAVVAKMLAKDREKRYQSIAQLLHDLRYLKNQETMRLTHGLKSLDESIDEDEMLALQEQALEAEEADEPIKQKAARNKIMIVTTICGVVVLGLAVAVGALTWLNLGNHTHKTVEKKDWVAEQAKVKLHQDPSKLPLTEQLALIDYFREENLVKGPNNEDQIVFNFPTYEIGHLNVTAPDGEFSGSVLAKGTVKVTKQDVGFTPAAQIKTMPQIMKKFRADDLAQLELSGLNEQIPAFLAASSHLTGVRNAVIEYPEYPKDKVSAFSNLVNLRTLSIQGPSITGKELAQWPGLLKIRSLTYINFRDERPMIQALARSTSIHSLMLCNNYKSEPCHLQEGSVQALCQIKRLASLNLQGTDATDKDAIKLLQSLPHLQILALTGTKVTRDCLPAIMAHKHLKSLEIDTACLQTSDLVALRKTKIKVTNGSIQTGTVKDPLGTPDVVKELSGFY